MFHRAAQNFLDLEAGVGDNNDDDDNEGQEEEEEGGMWPVYHLLLCSNLSKINSLFPMPQGNHRVSPVPVGMSNPPF